MRRIGSYIIAALFAGANLRTRRSF